MSYTVTITSKDIPKQIQNLLAIEVDQEKEYKKIIGDLIKRGRLEIVREIPVYTGRAKKSVRTKLKGFGADITGQVGSSGRSGWWINIIEYGRRSKKAPPSAALVGWVEQRLGVPAADAQAVAWAVARSIARSGIPGLKIWDRVRADMQSKATPAILAANERILNKAAVK